MQFIADAAVAAVDAAGSDTAARGRHSGMTETSYMRRKRGGGRHGHRRRSWRQRQRHVSERVCCDLELDNDEVAMKG